MPNKIVKKEEQEKKQQMKPKGTPKKIKQRKAKKNKEFNFICLALLQSGFTQI